MKRISLFLILSVISLFSAFAQPDTKLEAESAVYANCKLINDGKYSGGQALELTDGNAKITFTYNAASAGKYTVYVCYDGLYGAKVVNVEVNGSASPLQGGTALEELDAGNFIMNQGDNTIVITPNWTWFRIDYIRIAGVSDELQFDIARAPVDANASDGSKAVYTFLRDNFGKKTISGIMTGDMTSANGDVTRHDDVTAVYQASGKYPALIGFDFMNATGLHASEAWYKEYTNAAVELAKDTYRRGGLPAFTWHWRDPSRKTGEFYCKIDNKDACTMRITDAMNADGSWNTTSELYANIVSDIDAVADYFLALQEAGVACIFRPLHEASGAWFWWGASGAQPYVKLYQLIFDEMVSVKGVHNIIWVWNPCTTDDADWNPGEAYHDVISIDIYNNANDHSSNYAAFGKLKTLSGGKKLIALSENGPIPDIDKEFEEDAVWSWWMPWYQTWNGKFVDKTSKEEWTKCMNDSRVITLEDRSAGWEVNTTDQGANRVLVVDNGDAGANAWDKELFCNLATPMTKGRTYVVKATIKADNSGECILWPRWDASPNRDQWGNSADVQYLTSYTVTNDYQDYSWEFNADFNHDCLIFAIGQIGGKLYIDNVSCKEKGSDTDLVHNGDFESDDLSHWRILDSWSGMKSMKIEGDVSAGITSPKTNYPAKGIIYTLQGVKRGTRQDMNALPHGIYIVDSKKYFKK